MIYLLLIIVILTMLLYFIYRDFLIVLKITSIVTIASGILTFIIGTVVKYILTKNLSFMRVSDVINIIVSKFVFNSIGLLILGLVEFVCYFIISYAFDRKKKMSSV